MSKFGKILVIFLTSTFVPYRAGSPDIGAYLKSTVNTPKDLVRTRAIGGHITIFYSQERIDKAYNSILDRHKGEELSYVNPNFAWRSYITMAPVTARFSERGVSIITCCK